MGVLEWSPKIFWSSTRFDFDAALAGWKEKNGDTEREDLKKAKHYRDLLNRVIEEDRRHGAA